MYIRRLILENFKHLYSTTGLRIIDIDRRNSDNKIVLILGANGSGKSTLLSEFTLMPSENLNYRGSTYNDKIIPGTIGKKHIELINDSFLYKCIITYDKKQTNCQFHKINELTNESIDLNPNGNVSSYLTALELELNLKKNYTTIGYLSESVKNLVTMRPAERTTHVSSWIPFINDFMKGYRITQQKINQLKKQINMLNFELKKYDSGEIDNTIKSLSLELKELESEEKELEKLNNTNEIFLKLLPNIEKNELKKIVKKTSLNSRSFEDKKAVIRDFKQFEGKYKGCTKTALKTVLSKNRDKLGGLSSELLVLDNSIDNIRKRLISESIDLDEDEIKSLDNTINIKRELAKEINILLIRLNDLVLRYDLSKIHLDIDEKLFNELSICIALLNSTYDAISSRINLQSIDIFEERNKLNNDIVNMKNKLKILNKDKEKIQSDIMKFKSGVIDKSILDLRPEDCRRNCKLYSYICKLSNPENELIYLGSKLSDIDNKMGKLDSEMTDKCLSFDNINECISIIKSIENRNIIGLLNEIPIFSKHPKSLIEAIIHTKILSNEFKIFSNAVNIHNSIKHKKELLENLLNKIKSLMLKIQNNKLNIELRNELNDKIKKREELFINKNSIENELIQLEQYIFKKDEYINNINSFNIEATKFNEYLEQLKKINTGWYYKEVLLKGRVYIKSKLNYVLNSKKDKLSILESEKNKLISSNTLIKTRNDLIKVKNKIENLNEVWSPKIGISSKFINEFLESIKNKTNDYLLKLWNDELRVIEMEIKDNSFPITIEKKKKNKSTSDAYECSSGEKSTLTAAISLAMVTKAMSELSGYDILRLDEIDNALDSQKKTIFIDILLQQLEDMNCENCIMVTHNNEFDYVNADVILLKDYNAANIDLSNKNILFEIK